MPNNLDDFPYYQEEVLVRTFEEFSVLNPSKLELWEDLTNPVNWVPNNLFWNGAEWQPKAGKIADFILTSQGNFFKNRYPYAVRLTFTGPKYFYLYLYTENEYRYRWVLIPSGYKWNIFYPISGELFETNYGYGYRMEFDVRVDDANFRVSKIEFMMSPIQQDLSWEYKSNYLFPIENYYGSKIAIWNNQPFAVRIGYGEDLYSLFEILQDGSITKIREGSDPDDMHDKYIVPFLFNNRKAFISSCLKTKCIFAYQNYAYDWVFEEILNPPKNPNEEAFEQTTGAFAIEMSSDNLYVACTDLPIRIYKRAGDTFTRLGDPDYIPSGMNDVDFSKSSSTYLAVAFTVYPHIVIYKRSGDSFSKLSDPATLPTGTGKSCTFSNDDLYLAVGHAVYPYLTIYKRSGDTFTKLSDPVNPPPSNVSGVSWSSDGIYLACSCNTSPGVVVYKRSGDTFTRLTDPVGANSSNYEVAFSPDSNFLAVVHGQESTLYSRSGDTFTKMTFQGPYYAQGAAWSPDSVYLLIGSYIFKNIGGVFTNISLNIDKVINISSKQAVSANGVYFLSLSSYFPCMEIYKRTGDNFRKITQGEQPEDYPGYFTQAMVTPSGEIYAIYRCDTYFSIFKRSILGLWTREARSPYLRIHTVGMIYLDENEKLHFAYYSNAEDGTSAYNLRYSTNASGVWTDIIVEKASETTWTATIQPHTIKTSDGKILIVYSSELLVRLATYENGSWITEYFPVQLKGSNIKIYYKNEKLYCFNEQAQFAIYDIATKTVEYESFIYPQNYNSYRSSFGPDLKDTKFCASIFPYSNGTEEELSKILLYERDF